MIMWIITSNGKKREYMELCARVDVVALRMQTHYLAISSCLKLFCLHYHILDNKVFGF
jgi:hypothetical protein